MTIAACPHGCGNFVNYADDLAYCPMCRRDLNAVEVPMPEWCWAWWGPADHRMRCRLPKEHKGEHDTHEMPLANSIVVSTDGTRICAAGDGEVKS